MYSFTIYLSAHFLGKISPLVSNAPHSFDKIHWSTATVPFSTDPCTVCVCLTDYMVCLMIGSLFLHFFSSLCPFKVCITVCFLMTLMEPTAQNGLVKVVLHTTSVAGVPACLQDFFYHASTMDAGEVAESSSESLMHQPEAVTAWF